MSRVSRDVTDNVADREQTFAEGWNRFWFAPRDPLGVSALRVGTGLGAILYLAGHGPDLWRWFATDGLMPVTVVRQLSGPGLYRWSPLDFITSAGGLGIAYGLALVLAILYTLGIAARWTGLATWLVLWSFVQRAPIIAGLMEPVLSFMLLYLCLAPCGARLSLWPSGGGQPHWTANLAQRLIQLHLAGFYLMLGLSKLASPIWWEGGAVWQLAAQSLSRPVDLSLLRGSVYAINLWTHAIVLFELAFPVLIWHRRWRPLLLGLSVAHWLGIMLLTGLAGYCWVMLVAGLAFVEPEVWRAWLTRGSVNPNQAEGRQGESGAWVKRTSRRS